MPASDLCVTPLCFSVRVFFAAATAFCAQDVLADSAQLAGLLASLSNSRGDAVGRATRVQACPELLKQRSVNDLVLKYDDARTAHNSILEGWSKALATARLTPADVASQNFQLTAAQAKVKDFSDAARAALMKSGCLLTKKSNWLVGIAIAVAPVAVEKLWDYFQSNISDDERRNDLIRDLQGYKLPPWEAVGPVAVFDWSNESFLTAENVTMETLKKGSTGVYVNVFALTKEPNRYFTMFKELPPGLTGSYLLYSGPLDELSQFTVFKGKGGLLEQLPPK